MRRRRIAEDRQRPSAIRQFTVGLHLPGYLGLRRAIAAIFLIRSRIAANFSLLSGMRRTNVSLALGSGQTMYSLHPRPFPLDKPSPQR